MLELLKKALPLVLDLIPGVSTATTAGKLLDLIKVGVPFAIDEANELAPIIKTIIAASKANNVFTDAQLAELDEYEAMIDAKFDAAALRALAEDAAAGGG